MQPNTSPADLDTLLRRAGLTLTPEQIADISVGWAHVERFLERLRTPPRGRDAEMATVFRTGTQQ